MTFMLCYKATCSDGVSINSYTHLIITTTMTTNHRPTLESKRGRANAIKDTIQHSRSLNSQTSLKLRLDVQGTKFDRSVGKRALDELEEERRVKRVIEKTPNDGVRTQGLKEADDNEGEEDVSVQGKDVDKEEDVEDVEEADNDSDDDEDDEDDDEDDDEEALMAELAKIKKEKEKKAIALAGNPLISPDGNETTTKKSWRGNAPFAKKSATQQSFTTNTLESDTHRKFLSKYFR